MTRLATIDPSSATGKAKTLLDAVKAKLGLTPNMMKVMANSPVVLESYLGFSGSLGHGEIPAKLREQIALAVAEVNECDYCVAAHTLIGKGAGLSPSDALAARQGQASDTKSAAALKFVRRIVDTNGAVSESDVRDVRAAGYSDGQIAELIAIVSLNIFTNLFNKVADVEVDFPKVEPIGAAAVA